MHYLPIINKEHYAKSSSKTPNTSSKTILNFQIVMDWLQPLCYKNAFAHN